MSQDKPSQARRKLVSAILKAKRRDS